jgi:hypothetical protein
MTTQTEVAAFAAAYVEGNKIAQGYDPAEPGFKGAFQIADDMGHQRDTLLWDAAVGGAAAFYLRGSRY